MPHSASDRAFKLWHCHNARSLRALWALEEIQLPYELELLPFPPRVFKKDFLDVNALGTVPYLVDRPANGGAGPEVHLTESVAICHYLVERYTDGALAIASDDAAYGDYLNWLYHSDATLTFPQTVALRYGLLEPESRRLPQAARDYSAWFLARLRRLDAHLETGRAFLCGDRFTIADIAVGYALYLGHLLGLDVKYKPPTQAYLASLMQRPAFQRAVVIGEADSNFRGGSLQTA